MAELGIGVRCWIGWVPDYEDEGDCRCRTGTIYKGPSFCGCGTRAHLPHWLIELDDDGKRVVCAEPILFPIDDDGIEAEPREVEVEA